MLARRLLALAGQVNAILYPVLKLVALFGHAKIPRRGITVYFLLNYLAFGGAVIKPMLCDSIVGDPNCIAGLCDHVLRLSFLPQSFKRLIEKLQDIARRASVFHTNHVVMKPQSAATLLKNVRAMERFFVFMTLVVIGNPSSRSFYLYRTLFFNVKTDKRPFWYLQSYRYAPDVMNRYYYGQDLPKEKEWLILYTVQLFLSSMTPELRQAYMHFFRDTKLVVIVDQSLDAKLAGVYHFPAHVIRLRPDMITISTMLHELIHSTQFAPMLSLNLPQEGIVMDTIMKLYRECLEQPKPLGYCITNHVEFHAELVTRFILGIGACSCFEKATKDKMTLFGFTRPDKIGPFVPDDVLKKERKRPPRQGRSAP